MSYWRRTDPLLLLTSFFYLPFPGCCCPFPRMSGMYACSPAPIAPVRHLFRFISWNSVCAFSPYRALLLGTCCPSPLSDFFPDPAFYPFRRDRCFLLSGQTPTCRPLLAFLSSLSIETSFFFQKKDEGLFWKTDAPPSSCLCRRRWPLSPRSLRDKPL